MSLVGKKVRGSDELAIHAQVVRHPGYETLHIVYVKENTVVHHEAYSSRLPDQVSFLSPGETLESFGKRLDETVKRVGADGYYLVHNHPSGQPKPSQEDIELTEYFAKRRAPQGAAKGLQGHVVINSSRYAVIDNEGRITEHELLLTEGDKLLTPESKHAALGVWIKDAGTLASIAKNEQLSDKQSVVYYLTAENEVRGVQVVPNEILGNAKVAARYLRWSARAHYAKIPAIVTSDRTVYEGMQGLAKKGYVLDVVPVRYGRGIEGGLAEGRSQIGSGAVESVGNTSTTVADTRKRPLTKEQIINKPKFSPDLEKWMNKNGHIVIDKDGIWKYHDWEGNSVSYPGGYPDFKSAGMIRQEVQIDKFESYHKDFAKADEIAPYGPKIPENTWHHHQDGTTMQEVDGELHERFRHRGGMSGARKNRS